MLLGNGWPFAVPYLQLGSFMRNFVKFGISCSEQSVLKLSILLVRIKYLHIIFKVVTENERTRSCSVLQIRQISTSNTERKTHAPSIWILVRGHSQNHTVNS